MEQANRMKDCQQRTPDLTAVLSGTTAYMLMVDKELRVQYATPEAKKGVEPISEPTWYVLDDFLRTANGDLSSVVLKALESGRPQEGEISILRDGSRRFLAFDVVPVHSPLDMADYAVLTVRDATPLRRAERLGEAISRTYAALNSTMSLLEIIERAISIGNMAIECDAALAIIREGDRWAIRYALGTFPRSLVGMTMSNEELHAGLWDIQGSPWTVPNTLSAEGMRFPMLRRLGFRSFMSIPLKAGSAAVGILVFAFAQPRDFSVEEMDFPIKLSATVSLTIENSDLYQHERSRRFLLQAILDDVPSIILCVDGIDLRVRWANRFAQHHVPQRDGTENLIGKSLDDIIPGLQAIGISQMFRDVARTGRPHYVNELRLPGIRPEPLYWRGSIIPLQGERSDVPDLLIMAIDVTGQVEARVCAEGVLAQAEEEKERLHTILETLPIGAVMLDRAGRVVEMNAAAIALWTTIVPSFTDLKDLDAVQAWSNGGDPMRMDDWGMAKAALQGASTINEVVTLRRYDGREMIMMMSSAPLLDSSQRVLGAVVIGQDLTNQLHVQKEMVVSQEREELYLDILNHDIVNLNASAMGYLQLLLGQGELGAKERGWTAGTLDALEESSRLIDSVRGLHELEAGKHDLEVIDVDQALRRTVAEFVPHPARDIDVQMSSRGEHCVLGTPMVQEVFANIIDNAIRHSEGRLTIQIGVTTIFETGREYHRIEVSDDGPGIPPQLRENIFTRGWRGRNKGVGKGLGLFLVRRLVEEMEGRVWAEDRVPGFAEKGVRIVVLLPAVTCIDGQARNGT